MERFVFPNVSDNLTRYRLPIGMMNLAEFIIHVESMNANISIPVVRKAYEFSNWAHKGQKRASGEPYSEHCLNVAFILAEQHLDGDTAVHHQMLCLVHDAHATASKQRENLVLLFDGLSDELILALSHERNAIERTNEQTGAVLVVALRADFAFSRGL